MFPTPISTFRRLLAAATLGLTATAFAQINLATSFSGDGSIFSVSSTDLFQTKLASLTAGGAGTFYPGTGDITRLANGLFGAAGNLGAAWGESVAPGSGTTITFGLDLAASPAGYTLTNIKTYAGWDVGRDGQEYTISFSTASAPATFATLIAVPYYNPSNTPADAHTMVSITDFGGVLASNVAAVRFSFTENENQGTFYREIDAFGAATVPEPSTYGAFAGLGVLSFAAYRRRQRATATVGFRRRDHPPG